MTRLLGQEPTVVKHFMEELSRFDLRTVFTRNHAHGRFEHFAHPISGDNLKILTLTPCGSAVGIQIVQQSTSLILLHIKTSQSQQLTIRIAGIDHTRTHQHTLAILSGLHLQLIHIKTKLIELVDALLDLPHFVRTELVGISQRTPQRMVTIHQTVADRNFVNTARQQRTGRKIHQFANNVRTSQINVVLALAFRQINLQITGFRINQKCGERVGVAQEQHVRQ